MDDVLKNEDILRHASNLLEGIRYLRDMEFRRGSVIDDRSVIDNRIETIELHAGGMGECGSIAAMELAELLDASWRTKWYPELRRAILEKTNETINELYRSEGIEIPERIQEEDPERRNDSRLEARTGIALTDSEIRYLFEWFLGVAPAPRPTKLTEDERTAVEIMDRIGKARGFDSWEAAYDALSHPARKA